MDHVTLTIDDRQVTAAGDASILQAALAHDIYIPHLCYHPEVHAAGVCRLCMVEVNGKVELSCRTQVREGMAVKTATPEIDRDRRVNIEVVVANHHLSCKGCAGVGHCKLQKLMAHIRLDRKRVRRLKLPLADLPLDNANPFFTYDANKCVICEVCVHTCEKIQHALHVVGRGPKTKIAFYGDTARCENCGACVANCPVGALYAPQKALQESA